MDLVLKLVNISTIKSADRLNITTLLGVMLDDKLQLDVNTAARSVSARVLYYPEAHLYHLRFGFPIHIEVNALDGLGHKIDSKCYLLYGDDSRECLLVQEALQGSQDINGEANSVIEKLVNEIIKWLEE